jgi:hypothetical protein
MKKSQTKDKYKDHRMRRGDSNGKSGETNSQDSGENSKGRRRFEQSTGHKNFTHRFIE